MKTLKTIATALFLGASLLGAAACTPTNTSRDTVSLARPADELRTALIGTWYGKQPLAGGGTYEFVVRNKSNATYTNTYRRTSAGGAKLTQTETGHWGASTDHFYTTFKAFVEEGKPFYVNPMDTENYDIYKVLEFDGEEISYQHISTGTIYTSNRVGDDFKLP